MPSISTILMDSWLNSGANVDLESKKFYKEKLEHGTWLVEFTKTDGTPAVMECTLDVKLLPPLKEGTKARPEQDHLIHVYSLDRGGWRSFTVKNVTNFYQKPEQ